MKKAVWVVILVAVLAAMAIVPAFAHSASPCNDTGEPGNSDFAQHHIVPLAQAGMLGEGGHVPGAHQGYSLCNPSGK
ncbi:MAG TPA: hypothetical protein VFI11_12400 [Anaerolineales bacterium]|nr:hypothetical protein [Anaerolineales bacterium]